VTIASPSFFFSYPFISAFAATAFHRRGSPTRQLLLDQVDALNERQLAAPIHTHELVHH
jgi:hypothetical protein